MKTINKELFKSTTLIKLVLFLFLGVFAFLQTTAQTACPPDPLTYTSVNATNITTSDGEITITVPSVAVGPFEFQLVDAWNSIIQGPISSPLNVFTFSNLSSGYYQIWVENIECGSVLQFNVLDSIMVYPSDSGSISYSGFMGYCGSTGANITAYSSCASQTAPPFSNNFELFDLTGVSIWDTLTLADSAELPALLAGDYILQIFNTENNCFATDTFTITSGFIQSSYTSINTSSTIAADGSITVTIIGGNSPYQMWFNDGTGFSQIVGWTNGDPITGLSVGSYDYWVTDSLGCQTQNTVQIIYNNCTATLDTIGTCAPLTLSAQTTNILSSSYSYTYNLYFEGTLIEVFQSNLDSIGFITMVSDSGQYLLEVINDSTGCISSDSMVINVTNMSINTTLFPVLSQGACDGQIDIQVLVNGNTPQPTSYPFTITWDTNGTNFSGPTLPLPTSSITLLCENTYCVTVTDGSGCTISECYEVMFTPCNTSLFISDSIPCNEGIGELTATIDTTGGGVGPNTFVNRYTYTLYSTNPLMQIGPNQYTNDTFMVYPGLPAGSYLVSVYDSSYGISCSSDSVMLTQPNVIGIYLTIDSTSAPWILDGSIIIDSITGGTSPYSYQWLDSVGIPFSTNPDSVTGLG